MPKEIVEEETERDTNWTSDKMLCCCDYCKFNVLIPLSKAGPFYTKEEFELLPEKPPGKLTMHKKCADEFRKSGLMRNHV